MRNLKDGKVKIEQVCEFCCSMANIADELPRSFFRNLCIFLAILLLFFLFVYCIQQNNILRLYSGEKRTRCRNFGKCKYSMHHILLCSQNGQQIQCYIFGKFLQIGQEFVFVAIVCLDCFSKIAVQLCHGNVGKAWSDYQDCWLLYSHQTGKKVICDVLLDLFEFGILDRYTSHALRLSCVVDASLVHGIDRVHRATGYLIRLVLFYYAKCRGILENRNVFVHLASFFYGILFRIDDKYKCEEDSRFSKRPCMI